MSEKKLVVLGAFSARGICPVCGKPSYSMTGMHPQCAVTRADAIARAARKAAGIEVIKVPRKSWSKPCPKCKREIPSRRFVCDCGHKFTSMPNGAATETVHRKPVTSGTRPR